ncbi:MAG: hypothetical protein RL235_1121 [Chlamydiota bacterium]|jgi:drug/metabolite transporter (DMT)-like permease
MYMNQEHRGMWYGLAAAITNTVLVILIRLSIEVPTSTMVFFRFFISLCCLLMIARRRIVIQRAHFPKHLTRGVSGFIAMYCFFYAVKELPVVNAVTLTNTSPLFIPLLTLVWLKLLVSKWRFIAAAIGFAGVLCILRPDPSRFFEMASIVGLATGFLAAIAFIGIKQLTKVENTETILFYYFIIATIGSLPLMLITWEPVHDVVLWGYMLAIGALAALYQYLLTLSMTHAPTSKASMLTYLVVLFSGLAGWWIWGEVPDEWVVVGSALTVAGSALALIDKTPPRKIHF